MDPLVNFPNIVIDDLGDITMELGVDPCMITNTSASQVANPSPSSPKATRLLEGRNSLFKQQLFL
jgi:hypothetical protein